MPTYTCNTAYGTVVGVSPVLVEAAAKILDALVPANDRSPSAWNRPSRAIVSQPDFFVRAA